MCKFGPYITLFNNSSLCNSFTTCRVSMLNSLPPNLVIFDVRIYGVKPFFSVCSYSHSFSINLDDEIILCVCVPPLRCCAGLELCFDNGISTELNVYTQPYSGCMISGSSILPWSRNVLSILQRQSISYYI